MDMFKWAVLLIVFVVGGLAAYQVLWDSQLDSMYEAHYGSPPPEP